MEKTRYINENNPIYFSYASNDGEYPNVADVTGQLCKRLDEEDLSYRISKVHVKCGSINDFEIEIGYARCIIIVYNNKYFRSEHCMNEYAKIVETTKDETNRKIVLINSDGINLSDDDTISNLVKHWENVEEGASQYPNTIMQSSIDHQYYHNSKTSFCIQNVNKFFTKYSRKKVNSEHILDEKILAEIIADVKDFYKTFKFNNSAPHFTLPFSDGLLSRENEEEIIFNFVSKERILNLVGVGGSGKSSLVYLCLKKHKDYFNEIVYVVVNNNIENDFVEQTNKTVKLVFENNPFAEILNYLQENYKSKKDNLLVLDINETSDSDKNDKIINEIIQNKDFLIGWKILIISRENIDTRDRIAIYNLNENEDVDFLKDLFLSKAGKRYNIFDNFAELCKIIYYNPLLMEQLGIFLNKTPKVLSINEIQTKLEGDSFKRNNMRGMSAGRHDETIISFLKKLICFNDFIDAEKKMLRHFVLWQSDYIGYDVIADLLQGVFESEDELIATLTSLVERSILSISDTQTLSYKLHGLLAASLCEQIEIKEDNYSKYLGNIIRIIKYDYQQFMPFADCIGNSLCKYDNITSNYALIGNVALKFYRVWKANYSEILHYKTIHRLLLITHFDKNDTEYQKDLESQYNNLALLQSEYLGDNENAEINYQKSIEIREQLSKDNQPEHLYDLASSYNNIAMFHSNNLEKFDFSKSNHQKAIEIGNKLPKDNPECQNLLAMLYSNLASLQKDHLNEYAEAELNYETALEISKKLLENNEDHEKYQNDLAGIIYNIALLQHENLGKYESAEKYYKNAIEIREKLSKANPEYQNNLASTYFNLAILEQFSLNKPESAEINYKKTIKIWIGSPKDNLDYQNNLASAYNNLAGVQQSQKRYEDALLNIKSAMTIRKRLADYDSFFLNDLIRSTWLYASILSDDNEGEKGKEVLYQLFCYVKKHCEDNPNDGYAQAANQYLLSFFD